MKKFIVSIVKRAIEKHTGDVCYGVSLKKTETGLLSFEAETLGEKHNTYNGYVGNVGQIVITEINGKRLEDNTYIF